MMSRRAAIDFTSSWFDWFVAHPPIDGCYLRGNPNSVLSWTPVPAGGGVGPENVIYMHDYDPDATGAQAAIDAAAGIALCWDAEVTTNATLTVANPTHIYGQGSNALVVGAPSENDRGVSACIASGNLDPMLDIASDGVTIDDIMLDGDGTTSTLLRWACKYGRIQGVELKYASVGLEFVNQWDYTTILGCRLMAGLSYPIQIDLNHGAAYNNAHTSIIGCHISGTHECINRLAGGSGTAYDFRFWGCDFHDGHDADYMLDMANLHYSSFNGCNFEMNDTTPPGVGVVYCEALGLTFHQCLFGGRDIGAYTVLVGGSYDPIDVHGCTFANHFAEQTIFTGAAFAGVDACTFYNNEVGYTVMGAGATRGDHAWT